MKRNIIIIITSLITMTLLANNCSSAGGFFGGNSRKYTVQLYVTYDGSNAVTLSAKDAETMIGVLSKYEWQENRSQKEELWEMHGHSWGRYRFFVQNYYMTITAPDGRSVKMRVNGEGFNKDQFLIERANGKPYGTIIFDREKNEWRLKKEDIDKIKQLYFKNITTFDNVEASDNDPIHIVSSYSFGTIFSVKIPDIILSQVDSDELTHLYNRGWNNSIAFFPGGQPLPEIQLYTSSMIYTRAVNFFPFISKLEFTPKDQQAIDALVAKYMNGNNGEEKVSIKKYSNSEVYYNVYYQYKDGKLHGQVKVYDENGKLTHEFVYDKGLPATYIRYHANGKKAVEAQLSPQEQMVEWTEYDKEGNVTDSDRNAYQTIHNWQQDSENFYKFNREWRESPVKRLNK